MLQIINLTTSEKDLNLTLQRLNLHFAKIRERLNCKLRCSVKNIQHVNERAKIISILIINMATVNFLLNDLLV